MEETNEITLQELFSIIWSKALLIILITFVGGVVAFWVSCYVVEPTYTSHVSMYVNNNAQEDSTIANINDINASQKLVSTYIEILKSNKVLGKVLEVTGLPYTPSELRSMMSANSINGTEIFEIRVTTKDAEEAAILANTIAEMAPEEIIRVVKAGAVELIDEAIPALEPTSPNIILNTLIGMMLGGVLSVLGVLVVAMIDNRIKSEEDLKRHYEIPILGAIPDLEDANMRIK